jgi:hypothetical protein
MHAERVLERVGVELGYRLEGLLLQRRAPNPFDGDVRTSA